MSRLDIKTPDRAQMTVDQLYHDMERRIAASPPGLCPVDMAMNFLNLCHAQTCGKCVPCRVGLGQLSTLLGDVLDGRAKPRHMKIIEETAQSIASTAACAIGRHAAQLVLDGIHGFADDYWEHINNHRCLGNLENPVPCVALCPAGIDIPGYIALIGAGRCEDAIRLIRKDNPFPVACAYICEHPCEARPESHFPRAPENGPSYKYSWRRSPYRNQRPSQTFPLSLIWLQCLNSLLFFHPAQRKGFRKTWQ